MHALNWIYILSLSFFISENASIWLFLSFLFHTAVSIIAIIKYVI